MLVIWVVFSTSCFLRHTRVSSDPILSTSYCSRGQFWSGSPTYARGWPPASVRAHLDPQTIHVILDCNLQNLSGIPSQDLLTISAIKGSGCGTLTVNALGGK